MNQTPTFVRAEDGRPMGRPPCAMVAAAAVAAIFAYSLPAYASPYADALATAARQIDHAANTHVVVPALHVPPAPLGGPPRYSPSVDDWLQAELGAVRHERKSKDRDNDLRSIASALRYLAAGGAPASHAEPQSDVAATARKILADPAYHKSATTPPKAPEETIWERFFNWLGRMIEKLFQGLAGVTNGSPLIGSVLAIALVAAASVGLIYVGFRIAEGIVLRRQAKEAVGEPLPPKATADELYDQASAAAREGRYALAIALLFHASLLLLDRTKGVEYDPARTAGEYRRIVRRRAAPIAADFDLLARVFTLATYAEAPVAETEWRTAESSYRGLAPSLAGR